MMKIEIWSDIVCPFCYVGKRHLEMALEQLPFKNDLEVIWRSYQLDPNLPVEGLNMSKKEYLVKNKGYSLEQVEGMMQHLEKAGEAVGITFNQEALIPVNTLLAHRLTHFAQARGKGNEMEEALFYAHFTVGENVGKKDVLVKLASTIGFDEVEVRSFLDTDKELKEVQEDIETAKNLGISGVPFFVLNQKYGVSGAQPVEAFVEAITQAYQEKVEVLKMDTTNGSSCGIDGEGVC